MNARRRRRIYGAVAALVALVGVTVFTVIERTAGSLVGLVGERRRIGVCSCSSGQPAAEGPGSSKTFCRIR